MFFHLSKLVWFVLTPSNALALLGLAGIAAALLGWRGPGLAITALVLALGLGLGLGPVPDWVMRPLEDRFPRPAETAGIGGVIVLGGTVQPETSFARGALSVGESAERVIAMADLARRHPEARIVFTGGSGALLTGERAEADAVRRFAGTLGIEASRITFEDRSRTTSENARFTRDPVAPRPGERWLLVTSAFHMPRAVGTFRKEGFDVEAYPVDYRTFGPRWSIRTRNAAADGLSVLDLGVKEWVGLVGYRVTGRTTEWLPGPRGRP